MRHMRIDPHTIRMRQLIEASPEEYRNQPPDVCQATSFFI